MLDAAGDFPSQAQRVSAWLGTKPLWLGKEENRVRQSEKPRDASDNSQ